MPNQKVPQLPVLSTVTGADLFYVVDVSDTTDDPTGSSKQITRDEILTEVNQIDFNTTATTTHLEGRISWNDTLKTLEVDTENSDVQLKVGHEMVIRVNNQTGGVLTKGRAVYINGEQGNRPTVTYGTYTGDSTSAAIVGLIADDIPNNQNGYVIVAGLLEGINTSSYTSGTPLYLFTGGTLTSTKPQAPNHDVRIAKVVVQDATIGSLYVSVQNGYELDEIHDVRITSVSENDVLVRSTYNGSPVWVNTKTISGLTYVQATTISATTYQNLPPDLWTQNGSSIYYNGGNVGIGESNPIRKFEVVDGASLAYFNLTGTSGPAAVISTTDLTKLTRFIATDGTNSINIGIRTSGETANPTVGGQGDAFIYVNASAKGLSIVNAPSTGVNNDYIRLYAGLLATQGISHLHVQGSGTTKGFIGINNENPIARLHVSGDTLIDGVLSATTISATTISGTTFYGNGTNLTGVVKGSGTANYLPKWTGTTGQGNSQIQDDGTNIGVGNIPNAQYKMIVYGGNLNSIYGYGTSPGKYGVVGSNVGDDAGVYIGGYFWANPADSPINSNIYIGAYLYANADAGGFAYGAQIKDGTEGVNKVLISVNASGMTNWSSDLIGLTSVSATTISGGTMVITSTPTTDNTNTQLLSRDPSTGVVEVVDSSTIGGGTFNYGLANAIMTGTFLT